MVTVDPGTNDPGTKQNFYAASISASAEIMERAAKVEGIDQEITLLRAALKQVFDERPRDMELMLKGVRLLVQAVTARYRMSPQRAEELGASLEAATRAIRDQFLPPEIDEV